MKKVDLFSQNNEKSENQKEDFNCQCSLDDFSNSFGSISSLSNDDVSPTLAPTPLDTKPQPQ